MPPAAEEAIALLAPPEGPDERGRLGPYAILRILGSGGMGIVTAARQTRPLQAQMMSATSRLASGSFSTAFAPRFSRAPASASLPEWSCEHRSDKSQAEDATVDVTGASNTKTRTYIGVSDRRAQRTSTCLRRSMGPPRARAPPRARDLGLRAETMGAAARNGRRAQRFIRFVGPRPGGARRWETWPRWPRAAAALAACHLGH